MRPAPDLIRRGSGQTVSRAALGLFAAGTVVGAVLLALIAAGSSGATRAVALALLTPLLVLTALILWRTAQALARAGAVRRAAIAELRERRIVGILVLPELADEWRERFNRSLILPAGLHLLAADPDTTATSTGQRALRAYHDLLGLPARPAAPLDLPGRATLALLEPNGDVHLWNLSTLIERADAGDDTAREELYELELHVQERAMRAVTGDR